MRKKLLRLGLLALALGLPALLLRENEVAAQAVRDGLSLCAHAVLPSLFPFFAAVSFAVGCGFFRILQALRLPTGAAVYLLGLLGGYPVGARTVAQCLRQGDLSRQQAQRLLLFCNNAGPAFAMTIAGEGVFAGALPGVILYGLQALAALLGYFLFFRRASRAEGAAPPRNDAASPDGAARSIPLIFVEAVQSAATGMMYVCAFVVFFLVITRLLTALTHVDGPLLGFLELTVGILRLPPTRKGFALAAGMLGWGGVCVHCQSIAMLEGTGLSAGRYLAAKAVQGVIAAALGWVVGGVVL